MNFRCPYVSCEKKAGIIFIDETSTLAFNPTIDCNKHVASYYCQNCGRFFKIKYCFEFSSNEENELEFRRMQILHLLKAKYGIHS